MQGCHKYEDVWQRAAVRGRRKLEMDSCCKRNWKMVADKAQRGAGLAPGRLAGLSGGQQKWMLSLPPLLFYWVCCNGLTIKTGT